MLLAIISDTHLPRGARALPSACVERLRSAGLILHAGDISTAKVLDQLGRIGPPVRAVHGNVDEPLLQAALPAALELELDGVRIAMTHDAGPARGRLLRMRRRFPRAAVVIFGHSHVPLHEVDEDGFQLFNPGSPTERRRSPECTMGIAFLKDGAATLEHVVV
jgi:putative phosphoesterase